MLAQPRITRRAFLVGTTLVTGLMVPGLSHSEDTAREAHDLEPGEYIWEPNLAPEGPVAVVVSIDDQLVHVYRNGIRIAVSTCSTGKPGHETPTGVFTILQKDKHHHSSTYNNAPMPNMNRLTWQGIALHAGNLPGYPASHGCIRLPLEFSAKLFSITHVGMPVIIAGNHSHAQEVIHPGMILSENAEAELEAAVEALGDKKPESYRHEDFGTEPLSILVSRADRKIITMKGGVVLAEGKATIVDPERPLGTHVFILSHDGHAKSGLRWHAISHGYEAPLVTKADAEVISRVRADKDIVALIQENWHPGTTFVTVDVPAHPETRSNEDFVVVTTDAG